MAKRMLADVLWDAANLHLRALSPRDGRETEGYSCPAIASACGVVFLPEQVRAFLEELGCMTGCDDLLHKSWEFTRKSQGIRYMWLLLAMHVAEDEGIRVEVSA